VQAIEEVLVDLRGEGSTLTGLLERSMARRFLMPSRAGTQAILLPWRESSESRRNLERTVIMGVRSRMFLRRESST
jgi:hypothetical protein